MSIILMEEGPRFNQPAIQSDSTTTTVILFGGLPASGKSTLARRLVETLGSRAIHLEYDQLEHSIVETQNIQDEDRREAWHEARKVALSELETKLVQAKENHGHPCRIFLLDDNFHLRGMRKQIHRLLLNYKPIKFGLIWLKTPMGICLDRNQNRERKVPSHVFEKMGLSMELPRAAWEANVLQVDEDTPFQSVVSFVSSCPEIVDLPDTIDEGQQQADRELTLQSQKHNWDKLLRRWVGTVAKYDKKLAPNANEARRNVMKLLSSDIHPNMNDDDLMIQFVSLAIADEESRHDVIQLLRNQSTVN